MIADKRKYETFLQTPIEWPQALLFDSSSSASFRSPSLWKAEGGRRKAELIHRQIINTYESSGIYLFLFELV